MISFGKRVLCLFILCSFLTFGVAALIGDNEYQELIEEIAPYDFDDGISRLECIAAIMKVVGVDESTAFIAANADYMVPVFEDVDSYDSNTGLGNVEVGYVYVARRVNVVIGVYNPYFDYGVRRFEPERNITVKETLTAMLRCLIDPDMVSWENVMKESVKFGLLKENELNEYIAEESLQSYQFYTLIHRLLNSARYRYYPIEKPNNGWAKTMVIDTSNSMRYVDWYLEVKEYYN